jgi:hypothetical protein
MVEVQRTRTLAMAKVDSEAGHHRPVTAQASRFAKPCIDMSRNGCAARQPLDPSTVRFINRKAGRHAIRACWN